MASALNAGGLLVSPSSRPAKTSPRLTAFLFWGEDTYGDDGIAELLSIPVQANPPNKTGIPGLFHSPC